MRNRLKEVVFDLLKYHDENAMKKIIKDFRTEFKKSDLSDVAFPRTANNLSKYNLNPSYDKLEWEKGTPIHIKASLYYNFLLHTNNLTDKYELIHDGDKIYFFYLSGNHPTNCVAYKGEFPEEFKDIVRIDSTLQWEKEILAPIEKLYTAIGWDIKAIDHYDMAAFFK